MIDDRHAIAEPLGLIHVVCRQHDAAAARPELDDEVPELSARLGVESRGGLVEEEQLGVSDDRAGERQPLLLSPGQLAHARPTLLAELHDVDDVVHVAPARVEAAEQPHRLVNGQLLGELGLLKLDAEPLAQVALVRVPPLAEHFDDAGIRLGETLADLDRGGLARPIGAEQAEALAGAHREVESVDSNDVAVGLAEPGDEECG